MKIYILSEIKFCTY